MSSRESPKKSETLEVRLPYSTKTAFMARCRVNGRTASEAVRHFIEQDIDTRPPPSRRSRWRGWQALAAALAGLAVGAVAAPTLAHPTPNSRAVFDRLDRNHDGVLSFAEFGRN
ncbi:MAG TPA: EF-hand domain-containing protein [Caulobacteraceae bacterium]